MATPEVSLLVKMRDQITTQINNTKSTIFFIEENENNMLKYTPSFFRPYSFYKTTGETDLIYLNDLLKKVNQKIKNVCAHVYEEDYIDSYCNCIETSQKITYCSICETTF
jgi:hypothetical protein